MSGRIAVSLPTAPRYWLAGVLVLLVLAAPAAAESCDAVEVAKLRERLELEAERAHRWRVAWGVGFGVAAVGQVALTFAVDDPDKRATLWVGAAKATIGLGARIVLPLRIAVPLVNADPCEDRTALRAAIIEAGRRERSSFWLNHIGGFIVNAGAAAVLSYRTSWQVALVSFAIGFPIGTLSTYTMPRWAWKTARAEQASWVVAPVDGGLTVGLAGAW